jgi:hypothetical protein
MRVWAEDGCDLTQVAPRFLKMQMRDASGEASVLVLVEAADGRQSEKVESV